MKDEAISSSGDHHFLPPRSSSPTHTPAASSVGASSPAVPAYGESGNFGHGQNSKGGSTSRIDSQPMCASLSTSAGGSAFGTSQPSCRPWERGDLLRRLSTFKPVNWFQKPKPASSLACARRGWVNVDVDKIECESCGATLNFVPLATWTPSEADAAGEEFSKRLDEEHKVNCPWIGNCCAESLVQFPPTPPSALIAGYRDRCDGLLQFPSLPVVAASAIEHMRISRGPEIDRLLQSQITGGESGIKLEILLAADSSRDDIFFLYSRAQKLISLCGWEPRWLPNVQDCEEHSAQSARNGHSIGPSKHRGPPRDPTRGKKALSSSTKKDYDHNEVTKSKGISRSPLLDCSLCGATVRIWDFLTVSRPSSFAPLSNDVPESGKKIVQTRGVSAASGVSGWVAANGAEKELVEEQEEDATGEGKSLSNLGVDLNLTLSAGLSSSPLNMNVVAEQYPDFHRGRDLMIGQPSSSEVGDRAASYESRGPSSRKRILDEGGSTVDRTPSVVQQADSVEGTVIDRDGDEVDDGGQYSAGPSKRAREFGISEPHHSPHMKDHYGAGPSHSFGFYLGNDTYMDEFDQGPEQVIGHNPPTIDSTHVSSVIAMDTVHNAESDSMESVENYPGDLDDIHMPSTSGIKNSEFNEASEFNYSAQAQQSACPATVRSTGEMGVSSTNEEEVVNADTNTAQGKDGASFGISGGSVGMGASHEAEIHGTDAFIYRTGSAMGDVELVAEVTDNQGQMGEFALDPGLTGDFVPEEMDQEDRQGDNQDLISRSVARPDSGLKIVDSTKAESVESGDKTSNMRAVSRENSPHPSLSCNAVVFSGFEASKEEITQAPKDGNADDNEYAESGYHVATGIGPPNGGSNYDEVVEFDPIKHHNHFCSWVNGNVAAAGCSSSGGSSSSAGILALCGWQLTLDALDAFQTLGHVPVQTVESDSAASMYKDDHGAAPGKKLLAHHSFSKSRGKN